MLSLYSNFKLTAENCGREPINRPRAIQGYGHMLVFDEKNPGYLSVMSEEVPGLLGKEEKELWQTEVKHWMPPAMLSVYNKMSTSNNWDSIDPIPLELDGKPLHMIRHSHGGMCFIEIEPRGENDGTELSTFRAIRVVTEPLRRVEQLDELYNELARQYKKVTGYDRVMVYQFDKDYHGHVVGEAREDHLEPFLGLHYPATDIPKVARDLFLNNRSRIITDVNLENHWLKAHPNTNEINSQLDLTYTQLRATSPVHIEYLKNMGVGASFTLAIVIENDLWGLIACHHYGPKFLSYEMRKTGELIADALAQRIVEISQNQYHSAVRRYFEKEVEFLSSIHISRDIGVQLVDEKYDFTALCDADGCAVITNVGTYTIGATPSGASLTGVKDWLVKEGQKDVYSTDHLLKDLPDTIGIPREIGGMLSMSISAWDESFVMWFRKAQRNVFYWGGDPNQPYEVDHLENGETRLSPRKSFEKWKEQVDTKSIPWDQISLDIARHLREGLLKKEVDRLAERAKLVKNDYEQLIYVASHDLQEPLRTVTNYLGLLASELETGNKKNFKLYMQRTNMATSRMSLLIKDMLEYSQIGKDSHTDWVATHELVREIMEDLELLLDETKAILDFGELPKIKSNRTELKQLFQNLISNAVKYAKKEIPPVIRIRAEHVGNYWTFALEDNGIGIEGIYLERIFLLFQRLHGKDEYSGTGIGLAHCKRIIDSLGGRIWVTSKLGKGSTFWFSLHESIVKKYDDKTPTDLTH